MNTNLWDRIEQARAEQETLRAKAVRDFLQEDLLKQADPLHQAEMRRLQGGDFAVQHDPTVRDLLDRAAERLAPDRIEARFRGMPAVQADVLATVGETYMNILEDVKGREMLGRAVEAYRKALGDDHPATITARQWLAVALFYSGKPADAMLMMEAVCVDRVRVQGPDHPDTFTSRERLGMMYLGAKEKDPIPYLRKLRDDALRVFGPDGFHTNYAAHDLSVALIDAGQAAEAVKIMEAMKASRVLQAIPPDHPYVVQAHCTAARAYCEVGQPDKAAALLQPVYDHLAGNPNGSMRLLYGVSVALDTALRRANRPEDAARVIERSLAAIKANGLEKGNGVWMMRHQLGWNTMETRGPEAALPVFEANFEAALTPFQTATTYESIGQCHERLGRYEQELEANRKALEACGPNHHGWGSGRVRVRIGTGLGRLGKHDEAGPYLRDGYDELVEHLVDMPDYNKGLVFEARNRMLDHFKALGTPEAVKPWAEALVPRLEAKVHALRSAESVPVRIRAEAVRALGLAYADAGRIDDVATLYTAAVAQLEAAGWPRDPSVAATLASLREAVSAAGRDDLSESMRKTIVAALERRPDAPRDQLAREYFAMGFQMLIRARRYDEAARFLKKALEAQAAFDSESWNVTKFRLFLGEALLRANRFEEAEPVLRRAFDEAVGRIAKAPAWEKHFPNTAAGFLAKLCTATGRPDEAQEWQAERANHPPREGQQPPAVKQQTDSQQ